MKKQLLFLACYFNRNLRYGNSKNRLLQFFVIKSRFYLKKYINKNKAVVDKLGNVTIDLPLAGKMCLQTNDYIDQWLFTGADFEPAVVRQVQKLLKKGDNFLDLGTNIGYFSLIASRQIGETGTVYAFEPTPITIAKLKKNIALNNVTNIQLFEKAVSNEVGTAVFKTPIDEVKNSGRSSLRDIEENSMDITVELTKLDAMLDQLKPIKLLKMDIEGAEGLAFDGMTALLERDKPTIIMELSDHYLQQMGYSAAGILEFLNSRNYRIFRGAEFDEEINPNTVLSDYQYDILAVSK